MENLCQRAVALTDGDTFDIDVLALTGTFSQAAHAKSGEALLAGDQPNRSDKYQVARDSLEYQLLQRAMIEHAGNVSRAAKALSISRTTFYTRSRKVGLTLPARNHHLRES
jgi:DNA-binding NtrC family response regulator